MGKYLQIGILSICLIEGSIFAQTDEKLEGEHYVDVVDLSSQSISLNPEIDLETAVLFSLSRNPNIKISKANVALREGQLQSAGGEFDWTPFASVGYRNTESPLLTVLGTTETLVSETVEYSTGLRKKLRNGITLTPSVTTQIETMQAVAKPQAASSLLNLEVVIPLLRGSGNTSANALERSLDFDLQAAQLAYLQVLSDQTLATTRAYWRYAASQTRVDILASIEERAQNLVDKTNSMVKANIISASELPQARANLNDQRSLFLAAKIDYASDRYAFALALGLDAEELQSIPTAKIKEHTPTKDPTIEYDDLIRLTNSRRADINSIRKSLEGREVLLDGAKRDLLPLLDLTVYGGYAGASREDQPLTVLDDNLRGPNFGIELNMDFPVGNNFQRGRLSQREAELYKLEQELIHLKQRVTANAMESLEVVKLASERLKIILDTEAQYQEAVNITSKQFTMGEATTFELIDIEGRYARSTIDSITALRDYYIAVARLRFETGTLFKSLEVQGTFTLNELDNPNILTP